MTGAWSAAFAAALLTSHPHVPPAELAALADQAGLPGVARAAEALDHVEAGAA